MKRLSIILALLGFAVGTGIIVHLGAAHVASALMSVGWRGFAILVAVQLAIMVLLSLAWDVSCSGIKTYRLFYGRLAREAGNSCLPFSQVGGILLGIAATAGEDGGRPPSKDQPGWPVAAAATVVDVTTETMAEIFFVLAGLYCLVGQDPQTHYTWPLIGGSLIAIGLIAAFVRVQQGAGRIFRFLGSHIAASWKGALDAQADALQAAMDRFYASPARLAGGASLHLLGWFAGAAWTWLACQFLHWPITPAAAIAIEGVVSGILSAAFVVPGSLGVQEVAYVALGAVFGVDAAVMLGVSLLRRGRDLALGIPVLIAWQVLEWRALRTPTTQPQPAPLAATRRETDA